MPMYEFKCKQCGSQFEELILSSSASEEKIDCPDCGSDDVEKLMSAISFTGCSMESGGSCGQLPSGGFG